MLNDLVYIPENQINSYSVRSKEIIDRTDQQIIYDIVIEHPTFGLLKYEYKKPINIIDDERFDNYQIVYMDDQYRIPCERIIE